MEFTHAQTKKKNEIKCFTENKMKEMFKNFDFSAKNIFKKS